MSATGGSDGAGEASGGPTLVSGRCAVENRTGGSAVELTTATVQGGAETKQVVQLGLKLFHELGERNRELDATSQRLEG